MKNNLILQKIIKPNKRNTDKIILLIPIFFISKKITSQPFFSMLLQKLGFLTAFY